MGLFDNIKQSVNNAASETSKKGAELFKSGKSEPKSVDIVFDTLPDDLEQFKALPQASLSTPFDTAALTVLAFCYYPKDPNLSLSMVEFLKGPAGVSAYERSFIKDRFLDGDYVPRSYFKGAVPGNDYAPSEPYTVNVYEDPYTYANEGYAKVNIRSGGADSPRQVQLRLAKDGKWYLWEQFILVGIRKPESSNPWA